MTENRRPLAAFLWGVPIATLGGLIVIGAIAGGLALGLVPGSLLKIGLGVILIWSAQRIFADHR